MDAARLESVVNRGYAIAARNVGFVFEVFRPVDTTNPIESGNLLTSLNATFTPLTKGFSFAKPPTSSDAWMVGLFNPTTIRVSDYFVNADHGTFFVAGLDHLFPPLVTSCTNTIGIARPHGATDLGLNSYGGSVPATEVALLTDWPASLRMSGQGGTGGGRDLPMDIGSGEWELLLPPLPGGLEIRSGDVISDERGHRYVTGACEGNQFGWSIKCSQRQT